jgi:hypothetical protein
MGIKSTSNDGHRLNNLQNQAEMQLQSLARITDDNIGDSSKYSELKSLADYMGHALFQVT